MYEPRGHVYEVGFFARYSSQRCYSGHSPGPMACGGAPFAALRAKGPFLAALGLPRGFQRMPGRPLGLGSLAEQFGAIHRPPFRQTWRLKTQFPELKGRATIDARYVGGTNAPSHANRHSLD